jgi:hypothetical protein
MSDESKNKTYFNRELYCFNPFRSKFTADASDWITIVRSPGGERNGTLREGALDFTESGAVVIAAPFGADAVVPRFKSVEGLLPVALPTGSSRGGERNSALQECALDCTIRGAVLVASAAVVKIVLTSDVAVLRSTPAPGLLLVSMLSLVPTDSAGTPCTHCKSAAAIIADAAVDTAEGEVESSTTIIGGELSLVLADSVGTPCIHCESAAAVVADAAVDTAEGEVESSATIIGPVFTFRRPATFRKTAPGSSACG